MNEPIEGLELSGPTSQIYDSPDIRADADSITLQRILDVMYFLAIKEDTVAAKKLIELHENGGLSAPILNFNPEKSLSHVS